MNNSISLLLLVVLFTTYSFGQTSINSNQQTTVPSSLISELFNAIENKTEDNYINNHIIFDNEDNSTFYLKEYKDSLKSEKIKKRMSVENKIKFLQLRDSILHYNFTFNNIVREQFEWIYFKDKKINYSYAGALKMSFVNNGYQLHIELSIVERINNTWKILYPITYSIYKTTDNTPQIKTYTHLEYDPILFGNKIIEDIKSNDTKKILALIQTEEELIKNYKVKNKKRIQSYLEDNEKLKSKLLSLSNIFNNPSYQINYKKMIWDRESFNDDINLLNYEIEIINNDMKTDFRFICFPTNNKIYIAKITNIAKQRALYNSILNQIKKNK